jgi:hypothetical protein
MEGGGGGGNGWHLLAVGKQGGGGILCVCPVHASYGDTMLGSVLKSFHIPRSTHCEVPGRGEGKAPLVE